MNKKKSKKENDKKVFAFLAVFLSIIGFVIAIILKREDKYVIFYAKESLVLFISIVIVHITSQIIALLPKFSLGILYFLVQLVWLGMLVLWMIQMINAFSGQEKSTPIIGKFAKRINI